MIRDSQLKESLFKHYWAQRCFVQPEVDVYYSGGVAGAKKAISDVDVYALRPLPNLSFERILGDCRTLKGQSPINRALWLRGLMSFLEAHSGCVLLDLQWIEADHKLAASTFNIVLLNWRDFGIYDKSVNFPDGSEGASVEVRQLTRLRGVAKSFPKLASVVDYLYRDAWKETSFGGLLRHSLAILRQVAMELDPARIEHRALVCDAAAIFSIGLAQCCGTLFHQYLHPSEKELLSDSLKVLIWGGKENYELSSNLRAKLLASRSESVESNRPLELPEWNLFLQLNRDILQRPSTAFELPWLLRKFALDMLSGHSSTVSLLERDILSTKHAMLILEYVCKASGIPHEFRQHLVNLTVRVQTELLDRRDAGHQRTQLNSEPNRISFSTEKAKSENADEISPTLKSKVEQADFPDLKA